VTAAQIGFFPVARIPAKIGAGLPEFDLMTPAVKLRTRVLSGHRIEITSPRFQDGAAVEVVVTPTRSSPASNLSRGQILQMPMSERRKLLRRQSGKLGAHYASDPDRSAWQGGDIVE